MNKKGETLLEVLIALTLVTVSSAAAASAITSANKGLSLSKNYLVAQNLASEGLEIVKNIRDTNWMKFPVNKSSCWMNLNNGAKQSTDCDLIEYTQGANNDYYIEVDTNNNDKWKLTHSTQNNTVDSDPTDYHYGLKLDDVNFKYVSLVDANETANYYRGIRITNFDKSVPGAESITLESIVRWKEGVVPYEVKGTEVLTNYL